MNPYLLIDIKQIYKPVSLIDYGLTKLSHRSQVICALEAAKIVLPIWERYASENKLTKEQKEAPKKTIEIIEKWLEGKATNDEVKEASITIAGIIGATSSYTCNTTYSTTPYNDAAYNAVVAVYTAAVTTAYNVANSVVRAVNAASDAAVSNVQFYNVWWARCYPLIQKEFQDKYDILVKNING